MSVVNSILSIVRSEPIRSILYPLLGILVGTLVTRGSISDLSADTVIGIAAAILGIPATEYARAKVTPVASASGRLPE